MEAVIACINNEYIVATFPSKKGEVVAYMAAKEVSVLSFHLLCFDYYDAPEQ